MKIQKYLLMSVVAIAGFAWTAVGVNAQTQHPGKTPQTSGKSKMGMQMDMSKMKTDPHHLLMMAYKRDMAGFARILRDQALTPKGPDAEFARAAVAELRHDLDAMEAIHTKHMDAMSADMKVKMTAMMEKMAKEQAMVKEHVIALETAVQADKPDAKQVAMHANDLVKHFGMMDKMPGRKKAGTMKMQM